MSVEIEVGANLPEDDRVTLTEDDITQLNPIKTHTGKGDLTATLKGNRDLEKFAQRQDRINVNINGDTEWTGYLISVSHSTATTRLRADGIGKRLEETRPDYDSIGGPVTYSNIALEDALRDYWPRTPFNNWSVTDQSTEVVAQDAQAQDADTTTEWQNSVAIVDTEPFYIENGELRLAYSNYICDIGDDLIDYGGGIGSADDNPDFSGGAGRIFDEDGDFGEFTPDSPEWDLEYTIPEEHVEVGVIFTADTDSPPLELTLYRDGSSVGTMQLWDSGGTDQFWWTTDDQGTATSQLPDDWTSGDLEPGSYSLGIEATATNGGDAFLDLVCIYDGRFSYNFDDTNDGNGGYYDGPELLPDSATIQLDPSTLSYNITAADLTSVWDDTTGPQAVAVSNDGGDSFTSASNTESLSTSFSSAGRELVVKYTFGRYGSRTDDTPMQGFNGQSVDSYSVTVDGDDLVVIDSLELSRNHWDNLQTLHGYGDFLWVIEHDSSDISNLVVSSFLRGDETRSAPAGFDNPKNQNPEIQAETYYNSIYLEGALQDDGTRPTAEIKDEDAISNDGREISPGVLRDLTITTDAGASFRARSLLDTALSNNDLVGSITIPPTITDPGYAREVDLGGGEKYKTVEEVSLSLGTNSAEATFEFSVRPGFAEDISSLRREAKEVGDKV